MRNVAQFLARYGVVVAFVLLFLVNSLWQGEVFLKPENLKNLLNQNAAVGIIAIGMTFVVLSGGIDLSVGSLMALSAGLGLVALNSRMGAGAPEGAAVTVGAIAMLGSGLALGLLQGAFVAWGRVAPFIATLVGLVGFRSLVLALANGGEIRSASTNVLPSVSSGGLPTGISTESGGSLILTWGILLFLAVTALAEFASRKTRFGRLVFAVGSNEKAARYSAVNTARIKLAVYGLSGLLCGVAAFVLTARMNSVASGSMGAYYELDAIAAVVIGGTSLSGGVGRVWGTFVGVLLLGMITNMLVVANVPVYWQGVVKGAIILLAVLLQRPSAED
jgi:ribose transport system permease protein